MSKFSRLVLAWFSIFFMLFFLWLDLPLATSLLATGFWLGLYIITAFGLQALHIAITPGLWLFCFYCLTVTGLLVTGILGSRRVRELLKDPQYWN